MAGPVFILGAGFSRAISQCMPLTNELGRELERRLQEGNAAGLNGVDKFGGNYEHWLSYLAEPQPFLTRSDNLRNEAAFLEASKSVAEILAACQLRAVAGKYPDWLPHPITYWQSIKSTVLTFNYDILTELAYMSHPQLNISPEERSARDLYAVPLTPLGLRAGAVYSGSRNNSSFQLLKLHGSTTWYYSGPSSPASDPVFDSHLGREWSILGVNSPYHDAELLTTDKVPMIVPPTATKTLYYAHETLRRQWEYAATALRSASELFLIGYSLPPGDLLTRSLLSSTFSGDVVVPVDVCKAPVGELKRLFPTSVFVADEFVGDEDAVRKFVFHRCNVDE